MSISTNISTKTNIDNLKNTNIDNLKKTLEELYEKYKDDEYILNKLVQYIDQDLSASLINAKNLQITRENRKHLLTEGHNKFVRDFISRNIYFYCSTTEIFFKYDNDNYSIIKEDNIIHDILSTISTKDNDFQLKNFDEQLIPWKFKIKISIIKQIRELSLFTSIPESQTIQNVMDLFLDTIFPNNYAVKHFLTILGDNILKKSCANIYLISSTIKTLLRLLESAGGNYFGHIPLLNSFKYKYHDHEYNDCRLINIKNVKPISEICDKFYEPFQKNIIDIFVVCCYYSNRFNTADEYLNKCPDTTFTNYVLFLKNNTPEEIVEQFIESKIQKSEESTISQKNMLYLWKCHLEEISIPNILFLANLKNILKEKLNYDEETDRYNGYTSLGLPIVSNFIKFWDETMSENDSEYYLEIDEICILFKLWFVLKPTVEIKESIIINLIRHFYPDILIDENKYIYGINSATWCKKTEIIKFIDDYKEKNKSKNIDKNFDKKFDISSISIYELYIDYSTRYCKKNKLPIIIGKQYFELFINDYLKNNIS